MGGTEEAPGAVDRARAVVLLVDDGSLAFLTLFSSSAAEAGLSCSMGPLGIASLTFVGSGGSEETTSSFDTSAATSDVSVMIDWSSFLCVLWRARDKDMPIKQQSGGNICTGIEICNVCVDRRIKTIESA